MTPVRHVKKDSQILAPPLDSRAILAEQDGKRDPQNEARLLGKTVLHGLTIIVVGLRKYLKVERCEHCGR